MREAGVVIFQCRRRPNIKPADSAAETTNPRIIGRQTVWHFRYSTNPVRG